MYPDTDVIPINPKVLKCLDPAWILLAVDVTALNTGGFNVILTDPKGRAISILSAASGATLTMNQVLDPTSPPATTQITLGASTGGTIGISPNPYSNVGSVKVLVPWNWVLSTNYGAVTPIQILRCSTLKEALDFMR